MNRRAFFATFAGAAGTAGAVGYETAAPAPTLELPLNRWFYLEADGVSELEIRFAARDWADREIALARHHPVTVPS
jgi:hypothetical protein